MEYFKVRFKQRSGAGSSLSADMLFGHIIWQLQYQGGEQAVEAILKQFKNDPPFLLSNAMPEGFMPRPVMPAKKYPVQQVKDKKLWLQEREAGKLAKKTDWIPIDFFRQHQTAYNTGTKLPVTKEPEFAFKEEFITRNTINRQTNTALEGNLWSDSYYWLATTANSTRDLLVYVCALHNTYNREWFAAIFSEIAKSGFGKDKSTGKGQFTTTVEALTPLEEELFGFAGSHFISLSHCAGSNLNPLAYTIFTKYGKLGGAYSQCGINGRLLFAKKPLVFYKQGSSFVRGQETIYGMLIPNIHQEQRIVQYGFAFPLYLNYTGDAV